MAALSSKSGILRKAQAVNQGYTHLGWLSANQLGIKNAASSDAFVLYLQLKAPEIDVRLKNNFGSTPSMFVDGAQPTIARVAHGLATGRHVAQPVLRAISDIASDYLRRDLDLLSASVEERSVAAANNGKGVQVNIERRLSMLNIKLAKTNLRFSLSSGITAIVSSLPYEEKMRSDAGFSPRPSYQLVAGDIRGVDSALVQARTQQVARNLLSNWRAVTSMLAWLEKREDLRGYRQDILGFVNQIKANPESAGALLFAKNYARQPDLDIVSSPPVERKVAAVLRR